MKIVKEKLNEIKRTDDVFSSSKLGKYHIKEKIERWLLRHEVYNYAIDDNTLLISVHGNVTFVFLKDLVEFPDFINFDKVSGSFTIDDCGMTTLRGCPTTVGKDFNCARNPITSISDGPKRVEGNYALYDVSVNFSAEDISSVCSVGGTIFTDLVDHLDYMLKNNSEIIDRDFWGI